MKPNNDLFKLACLLLLIIFSSCEKEENSDIKDVKRDISGFWIVNETIVGNCSGTTKTDQKMEIFKIKQQDNNLKVTIYPNGDEIDGTIDGTKISWEGTLPSGKGKVDISFTGTITDNNKAKGTATWEWYKGTYRCSGTTTLNANKVITKKVNFEGKWTGTWTNKDNSISGTFSANVTQTDTLLTGTIDVPLINLTNEDLKGFVSGNVVYFGDINNKIKFIGTINEDSGIGTYSYMSLSDEGSWTGTRQ